MATFVKGLDLAEAFFQQAAAPIIARRFPCLPFSAGLIGSVCQFSPVTKLNTSTALCQKLRALYG